METNQDIPTIPRRRLGRTELSIPVIPFGTQGFGNNFGFVSDEEAVALVKHAVSIGVNHFDCARCYGDSMRKLGLALKEIPARMSSSRDGSVAIPPRSGVATEKGDPIFRRTRYRRLEDQLELLGIDYFDGCLSTTQARLIHTRKGRHA